MPLTPDLQKKVDPDTQLPLLNKVTGNQEDPLGFLGHTSFADRIRNPGNWLSFIGLIGLFIAFGHSILAMSGEETLAQVYREVESPKLLNFKRAAAIILSSAWWSRSASLSWRC